MRNAPRRLALLVALAAAVVIAACDGDDRDGDDAASTTTSQSRDFDAVMERWRDGRYRATYDFSLVVDEPIEGTITSYRDGSERQRLDVTTTQQGEEVMFTILGTPELSVFCLKGGDLAEDLGQPADEGLCIAGEEAAAENPLGSIADLFGGFDEPDVEILATSNRQIAGFATTCYRVRAPSADAPSEPCFSADGVLLAVRSEATGELALEATEFSDDVSDADFQPPYELREFPSGG